MKTIYLLIFILCLSTSCSNKKELLPKNVLTINVIAKHRDFVKKEDLGMGAVNYASLPGILIELIPQNKITNYQPESHLVTLLSQPNTTSYISARVGDQIHFINNSYRPIILDSYDLLGHNFPLSIPSSTAQKKSSDNSHITSITLSHECRNAVIFDRSGNFKIILTCNSHHKTYLNSNSTKMLGINKNNPLHSGQWTLRVSHPRLPTIEKKITLNDSNNPSQTIPYTLGPLTPKSGKKRILPFVP